MKTWRTGDTARRAGAVLAIAGASFAFSAPQVALATTSVAPKGDKGIIKIRGAETSGDDRRNEPKVCSFSLAGFGFAPAQRVAWEIRSWPSPGDNAVGKAHEKAAKREPARGKPATGTPEAVAARDTLTAAPDGTAWTGVMRLRDGRYRLSWLAEDARGKGGKHRAFQVECAGRGERASENQPPGAAARGDNPEKAGRSADRPERSGADDQSPQAGGGPPAAPPRAGDAGEPVGLNARTVATVGSTGVGLIGAAALGIVFLRRRGIGPFAPAAPNANGGETLSLASLTTTLAGRFGPLVGTGDAPIAEQTPPEPSPRSGPPTPPRGPLGPPRPSR